MDDKKAALQALIIEIADALAADRATKYLPIIIAMGFFIGSITVAVTRTMAAVDGDSFNKTLYINLEMHGIAFSSGFFWVLTAIFLGSIIGVSQTEERIRRILRRFHKDLGDFGRLGESRPPPKWLEGNDEERVYRGGLYSWRPVDWHGKVAELPPLDQSHRHDNVDNQYRIPTLQRFESFHISEGQTALLGAEEQLPAAHADDGASEEAVQPPKQRSLHNASAGRSHWIKDFGRHQSIASVAIVVTPTITGAVLSSRVPPEGWNCRVISEVCVFLVWLLSFELDFVLDYFVTLHHDKRKKLFWLMYTKDVICTLVTILFIMLTVSGCLNACSCWVSPSLGLLLPQRSDVDKVLRERLRSEYPAYIYLGIGIELLVVPLIAWCKYPDALRVFVQRDDGESNWRGWWRMARKLSEWKGNLLFQKRPPNRQDSRFATYRPVDANGPQGGS